MALSPTLPPQSIPLGEEYRAEILRRRVLSWPRWLGGLRRIVRFWHLTSLDAPTVAVVWCLAFAKAARDLAQGLHLPLWLPVVLGLCAWVFYIGDRLLDVQRAQGRPLAELSLRARHHFHWKHRRLLLPLAITAGVAALIVVIHFMPAAARIRNSLLAAATLAYFGSVHAPAGLPLPKLRKALRIPKELLVGLVFTAACALPIVARIPANKLAFAPVFFLFAALAWLNCHAIESWESGKINFGVEANARPGNRIRLPALSLGCAGSVFAAAAVMHHQTEMAVLTVCAALSSLLLAGLDHLHDRRFFWSSAVTLRAAADLALLTPIAVLLVR